MSLKKQIAEAKKDLDFCASRFSALVHDDSALESSEYYEECEAEYEDAKIAYARLKSLDNSNKNP
jgi:hypothetical protein